MIELSNQTTETSDGKQGMICRRGLVRGEHQGLPRLLYVNFYLTATCSKIMQIYSAILHHISQLYVVALSPMHINTSALHIRYYIWMTKYFTQCICGG